MNYTLNEHSRLTPEVDIARFYKSDNEIESIEAPPFSPQSAVDLSPEEEHPGTELGNNFINISYIVYLTSVDCFLV